MRKFSYSTFRLCFSESTLAEKRLSAHHIIFQIPSLHPALQHLPGTARLQVGLVTKLFQCLPGKIIRQLLENILRTAGGETLMSLIIYQIPKEAHLAPQIIMQRPADEIIYLILPLATVCHIEHTSLEISYHESTE